MRKPIEVPKSSHRSAIQRLAILLIPVLFIGITSFNLLYPIPTGPPDNGDFNRIFSSFSSGPLGLDFWPATENQEVYQQRFYNFYHRFWRNDEGKKEFAHFSSSSLFFWPGRCLNLTPGVFDLAWNTFLLILLGGGMLYLCLKKIHESTAIFSMGALALLFADVNIAGYLNSFYQESGTFLFFLLWVWFLHVFFTHRSLLSLGITCVLSLVLAGTKAVFIPSVLWALFFLLTGISLFSRGNGRWRRYTIIIAGPILLAAIVLAQAMVVTPGNERQANCYMFIFGGALPQLSPSEGRDYLRKLGLDSSLISLSGKDAYLADSQLNRLYKKLTPRLHFTAIKQLVLDYPGAFFELIRFGFSRAGFYPRLNYPSLGEGQGPKFSFRWDFWSRFHFRFLHGAPYFAFVLFLIAILSVLVWIRKDSGWPFFYLLVAGSFFPASILQILISVLGNGPFDIFKHHYFGNLLLDAALITALCGLAEIGITLWEKRKAGQQAS